MDSHCPQARQPFLSILAFIEHLPFFFRHSIMYLFSEYVYGKWLKTGLFISGAPFSHPILSQSYQNFHLIDANKDFSWNAAEYQNETRRFYPAGRRQKHRTRHLGLTGAGH